MITTDARANWAAGPVEPTGGVARLRPAGPLRFDGGFWGQRRSLVASVGLPLAMSHLESGGQLQDLRRAAGTGAGAHAGRPYSDSDVFKVAEALAWAGLREPLAELADLVAAAARPDGYLHTLTQCTGAQAFADLHRGHEMYNAGHLVQAAVAEVRGLGGDRLLGPATRFADLLVDVFGEGGRPGVCGHPQIETALVELYRLTGRRRYLDLAARMIDLRGTGLLGPGRFGAAYSCDHVPVRAATELDGHCVRALYLATGACDVYLETGDATLLDALRRQWDHTVATKTYLTGGVGCRRRTEAFGAPYELPPDHAFAETCAGVASVQWSWRMLLATGDARYADHVERVLFNVVAAGVSLAGDTFSYVNPLHRRATAMEVGDKAPRRRPWFQCACCPPNAMRLLASLGFYAVTTDDTGVQLHQYAAGTVTAGGLTLAVRTDYPWDGRVTVDVLSADGEATISLRVPGWCDAARVTLDGVPPDPADAARPGYLAVRRAWRPGDRLVLDLPMPARFTWPDRRLDAVRGCVAVERGPLVYCAEEVDVPGGGLDELSVEAGGPPRPSGRSPRLGGAVVLAARARREQGGPAPAWPYRHSPQAGPQQAEPRQAGSLGPAVILPLVPYHAWDNRGLGQMRVWLPTT